jgi:uncharacterized membrane protein YcaP (DUF421 family)
MELYKIAIRAAVAFVVLLVLLRLAGKRSIAQGSMLDFVVALIIGDLIDDAIWAEIPMSQFIVASSSLIMIHIAVGLAASGSPRFHGLTDGHPVAILRDGKPVSESLRRERISTTELGEHLRHHGFLREQWDTIRTAILELNGTVVALEHEKWKPAQKSDRSRLRDLLP